MNENPQEDAFWEDLKAQDVRKPVNGNNFDALFKKAQAIQAQLISVKICTTMFGKDGKKIFEKLNPPEKKGKKV